MRFSFTRLSTLASDWLGTPTAFYCGLALVFGWVVAGPFFDWSDTHSLLINTVTTIFSFLMLILLQASQNRDSKAIQKKLDALLDGVPEADSTLVGIERDGA